MADFKQSGGSSRDPESDSPASISIVQRGNLKTLEQTLRKQWRMGQNIVLCWSSDERGLLVIFVPHYFLGNFCALDHADVEDEDGNEAFIRDLVSGVRRKTREEMFAISDRLDVAATFIKLNQALTEEPRVLAEVEQLIRRYGISYVESRAVLLLDIVEFSLHTPFEQASQLNSLSYSLNSAYNKLLASGIEVNFARTTTGDGYYIWNRDLGPNASRDLFYFMLLVVADNAIARAASRGKTVPLIRTGFHIGSHYELYQAEGVNPTVFSYIVGDVTIELARMVDLAQQDQILIGDFHCESPGREPALVTEVPGKSLPMVSAPAFIAACNRGLGAVQGTQLSGKSVNAMSCYLTEGVDKADQSGPRRFRIVDKHGLSRFAYNLQLDIDLDGQELSLGMDASHLPSRPLEAKTAANSPRPPAAPSADEMIDDLASMLKKRGERSMTED